jgi:hypothetical protein
MKARTSVIASAAKQSRSRAFLLWIASGQKPFAKTLRRSINQGLGSTVLQPAFSAEGSPPLRHHHNQPPLAIILELPSNFPRLAQICEHHAQVVTA